MPANVYAWAYRVVDYCWVAFVLVWMAASVWTKRTVYRPRSAAVALSALLVGGGVILAINARRVPPLDAFFVPHAPPTAIVAVIVSACGLLFTLWARMTLGRNWSGTVVLKEEHELIERGPYRFVRHPIYTGILTLAFGTILLSGRVAALVAWGVIFAGLVIKVREEERLLLDHFPDEYGAYSRRVKRLIPFVW